MIFMIEHGDHCNFTDYTEGRQYWIELLSVEWLTDDNTVVIGLGEFHQKCAAGESFQAVVATDDPSEVQLLIF